MATLGLRFTFLHTGETADAILRMDDAPVTCQSLWNRLPVAGVCHHASYSGSEGVLILPDPLRIAPENATHEVTPGDIGFTWFAPGDAYGVDREFAEICWFYDRDARPSMHEGPAPVNLFARFIGEPEDFYARCRMMRRSGVRGLLIERRGGPDRGCVVPYRDPADEAPLRPRPAMMDRCLISIASDGDRCRVLWTDKGGLAARIGPDLGPGDNGSVALGLDGTVWAAVGSDRSGPIRILSSRDGGCTWTEIPNLLYGAHPALAIMPDGDLALVYETDRGIVGLRSGDGRAPWREMRTGIEERDATLPVCLPCSDNRLICAFALAEASRPNHLTVIES